MKPTRLLGAFSVAMIGVLLFGVNGRAGKPKPLSGPTITNTSGTIPTTGSTSGDLLIKWTESGLTPGTYTTLSYEVDGTVTSTYVCLSGGAAVAISCTCSYPGNCVSANVSTVVNGGCDVAQEPVLLDFQFVGLSGSKSSVSNTVDVDEADSSVMNNECASVGGSLLLYRVQYDNVTIQDTSSPSQPAPVGSGSFQATLCGATRLSTCPPVS